MNRTMTLQLTALPNAFTRKTDSVPFDGRIDRITVTSTDTATDVQYRVLHNVESLYPVNATYAALPANVVDSQASDKNVKRGDYVTLDVQNKNATTSFVVVCTISIFHDGEEKRNDDATANLDPGDLTRDLSSNDVYVPALVAAPVVPRTMQTALKPTTILAFGAVVIGLVAVIHALANREDSSQV